MDSDHIKEQISTNTAEIVRLHSRVHETAKQRTKGPAKRREWQEACAEFHARYEELAFPGGYRNALERISRGDPEAMEAAICFLELRPYFFRSGYMFKAILPRCRRAPLTSAQTARLQIVEQRLLDWKRRKSLLLPLIALLVSPALPAQQRLPAAAWTQDSTIKVETRVVRQSYCEGDVDLFSVVLDFEIQVTNNSKRALYMRSDMVQTFIRVASDLEAASQDNYLYESGGGTVVFSADQKFPTVREIRILPGRSTMLRVGGGLVARYKPDFSYPGTIPPGRYALQLMLTPEKEFPSFSHVELKSLIIGPVAFEVKEDPHPVQCH